MVFYSPIDYESNISETNDDRRFLTRRRLVGSGLGVLGLLGGGAWYVQQSLGGDDGDYEAPDDFPMLSTRGLFDESGATRPDVEDPTPARRGAWSFADAEALVVYVHGLNATTEEASNQPYTTRVALRSADVPFPVVGYSWDSDRDWEPAKRTADANGPVLADWLARWATEDGRPVHLVGHSLGARVICECLRTLAAGGHTDALASVSLLGGAIPQDSVQTGERYGDAIATATPRFRNFYSGRDNVLGWIYQVSDGTNAVGHSGIGDADGAPESYADVDVTDLVSDHYSYYEPEEGCAPRVAKRIR